MAAIKTIMTTNNNTERQYNQQDQQNHTGNLHRGLKGILSRSRPNENAPKQQQGPSSTYMARRHHQQEVVDDFLPNPRIPDSPSGTPPKKIWEGAYHKFLSIGKNNSSPVDLQVVPQTDSPTSTTAKKSGFSLLPGSRRLVTRSSYNMPTTPKSVPDMGKTTTEVDPTNVPLMPTLKGRSDSVSDGNLARHGSNGEENAVRGGNFFQAIFKQGGGSRPSSPWGGKKNSNASISHDELDAPLRKGIEKASSSPDYRSQCMDRKRDLTSHEEGQPATSAIERQSQIEEDESGGLDSLLASASSSPSYITTMNEMGMPTRASSLGRIHYPQQQQQQQQQSQRNGHMPSPSMPSLLIPPMIPPQIITEPPGDDKKHNVAPAQIPQPRQRGCLGSLLSQQVADSELDTQHHHHLNNDQQQHQKQPQDAQLNGVVAPSSHPQHYQQPPQQEMPAGSNLDSILSDPSFEVQLGASPSLFQNVQYHNHHQQQQFLHQHQQQNGVVNPEMKKAFTEFHNASRFAQDATSAFLGDDMSSSFRHDSYVSYHAMMMRGGGSSVPYHGTYGEMCIASCKERRPVDWKFQVIILRFSYLSFSLCCSLFVWGSLF